MSGVATWVVLDDPAYDADPPGAAALRPLPGAAAAALGELVTALRAADPRAAAALAPPGDDAAAELLTDVADGAGALGLRVDLRYVDESGPVAADGSWAAEVETTWRIAGDTGSEPARAEVAVRFRPVDEDRVGIVGFGEPERGRLPVWLAGPLVVARRAGIVVLVAGEGPAGRSGAERYLRLATGAVDVVRRVLPSWRGRLVVEVPASADALDRAMDLSPGTTSGIAAVTVPVDGAADTGSPVHVFVNPDVFARLRPTGAQVVLSHEAAHVATGAARSDAVPWLVEGFADYVALRDVEVPVATSAGQIIAQVRRDGVPPALPGPAEFAAGTSHLGATYESAWLTCQLLADRGGERPLVDLYDDVAGGAPLAEALRSHFDLSEEELTRLWQQRLRDLAA